MAQKKKTRQHRPNLPFTDGCFWRCDLFEVIVRWRKQTLQPDGTFLAGWDPDLFVDERAKAVQDKSGNGGEKGQDKKDKKPYGPTACEYGLSDLLIQENSVFF